jgi:hypothetical protein
MSRRGMVVALLAWAAVAPAARAQTALERRVTVHVKDVALRDALDRVAAAGAFKLSYSGDNLPLDRRVTVWRDTTEVREVLAELLRPYFVTPVALPDDQVVLAPRAPEVSDTGAIEPTILERVVVTGSVVGAAERALPVALDVVRGKDIERRGQSTLSAVFDGSVPGVWIWEQAPTTMMAHYGSIRGASSFGASYPKVYIDGIEVANPLLLTQVMPERIERFEVIRGPQGAALYGSDAISGVVNIVTRQDGGVANGSRAMIRSSAGYSGGYASNTAVQQHTLSAMFGSNLRSVGGTVSYGTSGAYIPEAYSHELRASGGARLVGSRSTLTASMQYTGKDAGVPVSPLLSALFRTKTDSQPQSLRSYTGGATLTVMQNEIWTWSLTGGVDGYALANVADETGPVAFFVDSALRAARGSALRATMRASAVARVGAPERVGGTLTFAAERSQLRDRSWRSLAPTGMYGIPTSDAGDYVVEWNANMGFTQQIDLAIRNTAYLTGGIRQESVTMSSGVAQYRVLPMLGAAVVRDVAGVTAKARVAFGRGIRSPAAIERARGPSKRRVNNPFLEPEEQSGLEGGVDFFVGSRFGLHVTRFDQVASGLIQEVVLGDTSSSGPGSARMWTRLENVGEIANRGWEAQATTTVGALALTGALSTVSSRVQKLAQGYGGDLRAGDRMLGVPARTLTGTAVWTRRGFQVSTTLSRASDWVNYDRLGIAECIVAEQKYGTCPDARNLSNGTTLRRFWATYDGNTRLRASTSFDLRRGVSLTLTGENLLNFQRGEPDSITIVPGRTLTAGIRARF